MDSVCVVTRYVRMPNQHGGRMGIAFGTVVFRPAFVSQTSAHRTRQRAKCFNLGLESALNIDPLDVLYSPSSEALFYFQLGREQKLKGKTP